MTQNGAVRQNDIIRVSTLTQAIPEFMRQEYHNEINAIVEELNGLLPQLRIQVGVNFHALAHNEVMRLTVYACDDSLDLNALGVLRRHLARHQQMFNSMLADPAEAL